MKTQPDTQDSLDVVKLHAVFVPDGHIAGTGSLPGAMDTIRLTVRFRPGGEAEPDDLQNGTEQPATKA